MTKDLWRNRIVAHGEEDPEQLLANPFNFRFHPYMQEKALAGSLTEVGWVQSVIVNHRTEHVIDGHLRIKMAMDRGEPYVPVTYVDLTLDEERAILASFDQIGAMASVDSSMLDDLLSELTVEDPDFRGFLEGLSTSDDPFEEGSYEDTTPAWVIVGNYKFSIKSSRLKNWVEEIREDVGEEREEIVKEIASRLGLEIDE